MTTYYKATFADGTVLTRSTAGRSYSHAWLVRYHVQNERRSGDGHTEGFSRTEALARKGASGTVSSCDKSDGYSTFFHGTAPAIEITGAEYRALKAGAR